MDGLKEFRPQIIFVKFGMSIPVITQINFVYLYDVDLDQVRLGQAQACIHKCNKINDVYTCLTKVGTRLSLTLRMT